MELQEAVYIPAVAALVEIIKNAGLPSKYAGIASVVVGLGLAFLSKPNIEGFIETTLRGLIIGLSASGLYSGGKALVK